MAASDPRERLLELSAERGVSLAQLSALIGRNSAYLQQFVRKGSPRKLEEGDRATLARFFGVSEGELGASEEKSSNMDWIDVPRLALGASAGPGALAQDEQPIGAFRFGRAWLRRQGLDPRGLSAISVDGDSMEPVLRDGDEILVDSAPRPLRDGIHVVRVDGALLVKRLETGRPGLIVLKSDNPAYDPIELTPRDVDVVGRVVWKGGRL
ncbi:transcriptional regulator [Novosphingobium sp. G106]|uniref:S24 family peptidase n=1 Tax=Novosphingobium sp. G106 TaxID=2849500 RepID=UPI001C2D8046|nr:LexA family transcriptional regulator [Novosphingobium sp. G106]MBV1687997.1 transcriptional regulator [Novosphingobium sp. G106]